MLFIIIVLSLTCVVITYFVQNCRLFSSRTVKPLPGPIRLPFIGSTYHFLQRNSEDFLNVFTKLTETYSSPFQMWIGTKLFIIMYEPDQVKAVLQSRQCMNKGLMYKVLEPIFGLGLVTALASIWVKTRKIIAPTVGTITLKESFNTFVQESLILTEDLEKNAQSGNEIVLDDYLYRCTLKISYDILMGVKIERDIIDKWLKITTSIRQIWRYRFRKMFLIPDIIFNRTSLGHEQRECINITHSIIEKIIQQRTNESSTTSANGETSNRRFIDTLIYSFHNEKFTQKEIMDNAINMITGSTDTTATTMNFVIVMLANFPEIQEKAYKELLKIYGTEIPKFAPIKYEDLQHMHYLDCIIKETLRLFPSIPMIGRDLTEDLKIGEFVLPKDANVIMSFMRMHRNEKYWPNPLMFDPDRFLPENTNNCIPYYFMPFSDGPRNCVGFKYAMLSMKVILATLLRTFVFKLNQSIEIDKIKLNSDIVLSAAEPLKVKIEKRNL